MNPGIFIKLKAEVILFHGVVSANNESKPVDKNTFPVIVITAIDLYRKKDGSIIITVNKAAVIAVAKTFFKICNICNIIWISISRKYEGGSLLE